MNNEFVVSFCVPVYNRAEVSYLLARDLLENTDERFQVVISDNNSSDNTIELLKTINDKRLKICINEDKEQPPTVNWYNALEHGDGEFLYLVMGRDKLYSENIEVLIDLLMQLQDKNIGFLRDRGADNAYDIYSKAGAAIKFLGRDHPTGLIINNKNWRKIYNRKDFFCIKNHYYPENYIKGELLKFSNAAIISSGVFNNGKDNYRMYIDRKKDKSKMVKNNKDLFIFPKNNLSYLKRITSIIEGLNYTDEEMCYIIFRQYRKHLSNGIIAYGIDRKNEELCGHYNIKPRTVPRYELIYELIKFHISYSFYLKRKKKSWYDKKCRQKLFEAVKECWIEVLNMY